MIGFCDGKEETGRIGGKGETAPIIGIGSTVLYLEYNPAEADIPREFRVGIVRAAIVVGFDEPGAGPSSPVSLLVMTPKETYHVHNITQGNSPGNWHHR